MRASLARVSFVSLALGLAAGCMEPASAPPDDPAETSSTEQAATSGPPGTTQTTLLPARGLWSYYDGGGITDPAWRNGPGCTAAGQCFEDGFAPLGYGESYVETTIDYGGDPGNKHVTTYFRDAFHLDRPVRALFLRVMYDDGFVFYLNGKEGGRAAMPSGTVTPTTLSTGHEAGNAYRTFDISSQIPRLREGDFNWLAFEVHQASRTSSDLVFDAELIAWVDGPTDVTSEDGIARGSAWRVWDTGGVAAAWSSATHDDSGWKVCEGPLGYGESYLACTVDRGPITTYVRKQFTVTGARHGLTAEVMYDDGFVAYLNGTEVGRASMPPGPIDGSTRSTGHEAGNAYVTFDWDAAASLLVDGENTLAVEVHQSSSTSSDLVFDLALTIEGAWDPQPSGTDLDLTDVVFLDAMRGWAVGADGTIRRTSDGGASWSGVASGTTSDLWAISFGDATRGWIAGFDSTVLRTTDGGATWAPQTATTTAALHFDVEAVSGNEAWLTGATGALLHTTDGGATWSEVAVGIDARTSHVDFADPLHGWVSVGENDDGIRVLHTADGGATWSRDTDLVIDDFYSITDLHVVDASTAWVATRQPHDDADENLYVTRDGGATWTRAPRTANNMHIDDIFFLDELHGWAIGAGGSIIGTRDGGQSWEILQVDRRVEGADRVIGVAPAYHAVWFTDLDHGWIVGQDGTILHTTTGGR